MFLRTLAKSSILRRESVWVTFTNQPESLYRVDKMEKKQKKYIFPETLAEASELLKGENVLMISGGTTFKFRNLKNFSRIVDISRVAPDSIKINDKEIILGSMVRIGRLLENKSLRELNCGILASAASNIASTPIRNQITLGGNLTMIYRWTDLPVSILVLAAEIRTVNGNESMTYTAEDFFASNPSRKLARGEIVKELIIPVHDNDYLLLFKTFNKTKGDFAAINMAAGYKLGDVFSDLRIAISAISNLPVRLKALERDLEGSRKDEKVVVDAIAKHLPNFKVSDFRYNSEYLNQVAKVMLKRLLLVEDREAEL